jgi:hypothetical protein
VKRTVDDFKRTVKKGDLSRVQSRIDASSFESRMTREQLKQLVSESF